MATTETIEPVIHLQLYSILVITDEEYDALVRDYSARYMVGDLGPWGLVMLTILNDNAHRREEIMRIKEAREEHSHGKRSDPPVVG